jgi:hypothetical protein
MFYIIVGLWIAICVIRILTSSERRHRLVASLK